MASKRIRKHLWGCGCRLLRENGITIGSERRRGRGQERGADVTEDWLGSSVGEWMAGGGGSKNSGIAAGECIIAVTVLSHTHKRYCVLYVLHTHGILGQVLFGYGLDQA